MVTLLQWHRAFVTKFNNYDLDKFLEKFFPYFISFIFILCGSGIILGLVKLGIIVFNAF